MTGSPIARFAWRSLLLVALLPIALGVRGLVGAQPLNPSLLQAVSGLGWEDLAARQPGLAHLVRILVRHESLALLGWGWWLLLACFAGPRSGRWTWYGWWSVPILELGFRLTGARAGGPMPRILLAAAAFTVIALLVSRSAFFGSHTASTPPDDPPRPA